MGRPRDRAEALAALAIAANVFPEQRLCQIIVNAIPTSFTMGKDPFYVTDEALAEHLTRYLENYNAPAESLTKKP